MMPPPARTAAEPLFAKALKALHAKNYAKAQRLFRDCIKVDQAWFAAWCNLGAALFDAGRYDEALKPLEMARRLAPDSGPVHFNLAQALLMAGRWPEGFAEYRERWGGDPTAAERRIGAWPRWQGEPRAGRPLVVLAEQGMGDIIMFARFLPRLPRDGGPVIMECPPALRPVFAGFPGVDQVVDQGQYLDPGFPRVPLGDLPGLLGATLDNVRPSAPYLRPDQTAVAEWGSRLAAICPPGRRRVGLIWQGNPAQACEPERSIPLHRLMPLLSHPDLSIVSLQRGHGLEQLDQVPEGLRPPSLGPSFGHFGDTAAAMANLDLIVTTCTGPAHLAGALGRPTWLMLKKVPDWRWLAEGETTVWYPSMRLFRQARAGEWDPVVRQVVAALPAM